MVWFGLVVNGSGLEEERGKIKIYFDLCVFQLNISQVLINKIVCNKSFSLFWLSIKVDKTREKNVNTVVIHR